MGGSESERKRGRCGNLRLCRELGPRLLLTLARSLLYSSLSLPSSLPLLSLPPPISPQFYMAVTLSGDRGNELERNGRAACVIEVNQTY